MPAHVKSAPYPAARDGAFILNSGIGSGICGRTRHGLHGWPPGLPRPEQAPRDDVRQAALRFRVACGPSFSPLRTRPFGRRRSPPSPWTADHVLADPALRKRQHLATPPVCRQQDVWMLGIGLGLIAGDCGCGDPLTAPR